MANSRKEYVEAAKSAFIKLVKKSALKNLALKWGPWVTAGPMGAIVGWIVGEVIEAGIEKGETGIFFLYVDFRVYGQEKDFVESALNHYRVQQNGTQEQKDEAEKKLIDAFDRFVKLNHI